VLYSFLISCICDKYIKQIRHYKGDDRHRLAQGARRCSNNATSQCCPCPRLLLHTTVCNLTAVRSCPHWCLAASPSRPVTLPISLHVKSQCLDLFRSFTHGGGDIQGASTRHLRQGVCYSKQ
jgi:hypothetical protein